MGTNKVNITVRLWVRVITKHWPDITGLVWYFKPKTHSLLKHYSNSQMRYESPQSSMEIGLQCQKLNYYNHLPNH